MRVRFLQNAGQLICVHNTGFYLMLQAKRRPTDPETVTDDALRMMCENVLQLMTTTVDGIDQV